MMKASLVGKYKCLYFGKQLVTYKTAAGMFESKYSIKISFTLNEFGVNEKTEHQFDLDENDDGI